MFLDRLNAIIAALENMRAYLLGAPLAMPAKPDSPAKPAKPKPPPPKRLKGKGDNNKSITANIREILRRQGPQPRWKINQILTDRDLDFSLKTVDVILRKNCTFKDNAWHLHD